MITGDQVNSFARLTGNDPAKVRSELISMGHFELMHEERVRGLEQELKFYTTGETTAYASPTAAVGIPLSPEPRIVYGSADVIVNGRRRVSLRRGGPDVWIPVRSLASYVSRSILGIDISPGSRSWLTKRVAGLPVYGWGLLGIGAAAAVALAMFFRGKR